MMFQPQIIASQITNLTDARYFAAWGVEWLCFTLESGAASFINPIQVNAIKEWVTGPKIMGSFSGLDVEAIEESVRLLSLDAVEVSRFARLDQLNLSIPILVSIVVENGMTVSQLTAIFNQHSKADFFILDFEKNRPNPDETEVMDSDHLSSIIQQRPIFIHFGKTVRPIPDLVDDWRPYGIRLAGSEEEQVGVKTFDELDDLLEILRAENF